jgi:hypothetical protein
MPKQVIVQSSIETYKIIDTPIPTPGRGEVVIKVAVAGTNPKDWKYPLWYVVNLEKFSAHITKLIIQEEFASQQW